MRSATIRIALMGGWLFLLSGCDPVSLTLLGVGAGAGVNYTLNGIAYKTFTEPLPKVKKATLTALNRMAIKVCKTEKAEKCENITASTADRDIEIELEVITAKTTRIRVTARKKTALIDSATAQEIITQTEKVL